MLKIPFRSVILFTILFGYTVSLNFLHISHKLKNFIFQENVQGTKKKTKFSVDGGKISDKFDEILKLKKIFNYFKKTSGENLRKFI